MDGPGAEFGGRIRLEQQLQGRRKGCRYPEALQREVAGWAAERIAAGHGARAVGAVLGLHDDTVTDWVKRYGPASAEARAEADAAAPQPQRQLLLPVRVTVREARGVEASAPSLEVVTPGGYRLAGLSRAEALALFQSLP